MLCAKGYSYEEIAPLLALSRHTVTSFVKRMYRRLQMHSEAEAVVMLVMYLFAFRFDARRFPSSWRGFVGFVVVSGAATQPFWPYDAIVMQHAANLAAALFVTVLLSVLLSVLAWRGGSRELGAIVAPCGSMLVIGSFLYASMRRLVGAIDQVEAANTALADWEREIEVNHQQLRRMQEVLINVIKHAGAHSVTIVDDGRGFDPPLLAAGRGLGNMQHRAALLGGRLAIKSSPAEGSTVSLWLPLAA